MSTGGGNGAACPVDLGFGALGATGSVRAAGSLPPVLGTAGATAGALWLGGACCTGRGAELPG